MLVHTLFSKVNGQWRFGWNVVFQYLFNKYVLEGLWLTVFVTIMSMLIGFVLGMILAVMRMSSNRLMTGIAWLYTWFFRGTPVYVQLLFWYNIAILYQSITLGIPFSHAWTLLTISSNSVFTVVRAAIVAFGLN